MTFLHKAFVDFDPTVWWFIAWALTIPLYIGLQAWFGIAWKGRWRIVALVPLAGFVLVSIFLCCRGLDDPRQPAPRSQCRAGSSARWLSSVCADRPCIRSGRRRRSPERPQTRRWPRVSGAPEGREIWGSQRENNH